MNRNLWNEWGPRFHTYILQAAWCVVMPLALLLLIMLYPLGLVVEACERDAEKQK